MKSKNIEYRMQNIGFKQKFLSHKFYQLNSSKTVGFTLVELIVVIVILAILGTIAFISFQGYSRNSRDSVRIADINSTKKSLEIFITKAGFYPTPDNPTNITYSGAIVWTEGTLGSNVTKNIQSVSKVITDPLTANEYTYSITSSKTEYQIGAISEGGGLTQIQSTNKTYAADLSKSSAVAYISGNYNEKFTKVSTGTTSWILAQPSIIATDIGNSDLANILSTKKLSYNNYSNIPHSYNTPGTESGGFNYTNGNPIIFTGTLEELHEDNQRKLDFLTNLKQAYTSTDLATNPMYHDIMNIDTTNDSTGAINLVISYINSNKGGIKLEELALLPTSGTTGGGVVTYSCATQPDYTYATYIPGEAKEVNQPWQSTNSENPCYYECTNGYSGSDCSTAPITTWQDEDPNCIIDTDFTITGTDLSGTPISQVWAACNSTLGIGVEYNTSNNCYNYQGTNIGGTSCYGYNNLESTYNSTGVNNIWGKLYTWDNAPSACSSGWHLPSQTEWTILLKNLGCSDYGTDTTIGRLCDGLGWSGSKLRTNTNNLENALKIPLAGYKYSDATPSFTSRGNDMYFWSSNYYDLTYARGISFSCGTSLINRNKYGKLYGFSVRCVKD
ncbi:MAG: FISUMP domain-containing protein [Candidatus Gracilibacteria bacterium]|nr:FISUMP domain-containing protein [Candidatus Gracilibacteria bacterium]